MGWWKRGDGVGTCKAAYRRAYDGIAESFASNVRASQALARMDEVFVANGEHVVMDVTRYFWSPSLRQVRQITTRGVLELVHADYLRYKEATDWRPATQQEVDAY